MVLYFFKKSAYPGGEDIEYPLNLFKWNEDMCFKEWDEGENENVVRYNLDDPDYRWALQNDFNNNAYLFSPSNWLLRVFPE